MAEAAKVITITMNTAIDRVLEASGFIVGAHIPALLVSGTPAGKGVNTSRALARLDRASTATGFVGDRDLKRFKAIMAEGGCKGLIDNQLIPVPGSTRENITIIDPASRTVTHLRMPGFNVTGDDLVRLKAGVEKLCREGAVMVFAGSLPSGMGTQALIELVRAAKAGGARIVLDLAGPVLGKVLEAVNGVWLVSPNRSELAEATGKPTDMPESQLLSAAQALGARTEWVLLSLGDKGAWLVSRHGAWRGVCAVERKKVVNTVGAGDCLLAAVMDSLLKKLKPDDALRQGLAVASACILNADPGGFDIDDVQELHKSTEIHRLH